MRTGHVLMLVLKAAVVLVVAVVALVSFGREQRAEAQAGDLTGVYCMDLYTDGGAMTPKGSAHQSGDGIQPGNLPETKILTRVESGGGGTWDLTSVAYRGPGGFSPTAPPTNAPCATKTDGNTLSVPPQPIEILARPTANAVVTIKTVKSLEWDICTFEEELDIWVNTHWNVRVNVGPPFYGELLVDIGSTSSLCNSTATGQAQRVVVEMFKRVATKGTPGAGADDWDNDGVSDWNELSQTPPTGFCDPFSPPACDVVGGVAEAPGLTSAPAQANESAGGVSALWAIGIAVGAGAAGTIAGVWYLRRRRADG